MSYIARVALATDRLLNATLLGGSDTETISHHAARKAEGGRPWACGLCAVLAVLIQSRHCQRSLDDETPGLIASLRAGVCIFVAYGLVTWAAVKLALTMVGVR